MLGRLREHYRIFTFGDPREGIALRKFAKLYRRVDAGPCPRCAGTGIPGFPAEFVESALAAGVPACPNCTGTGRKVDDVDVAGGHIEVTTNRHGFAHIGVAVKDEEDVMLKLAIPRVFAIWLGIDLGRAGFGWNSWNPLRHLFIRGRPEHVGGKGIRPGLLGYGEREFELEAARGVVRLKLGVAPHGGSSNRLSYRRRFPWEWLRDVRKSGQLAREGYRGYARSDRWRPPQGPWERVGGELVRGEAPPERRSRLERVVYRYIRWRSWLPEYGFEVTLLRYDWRDFLLGPRERLEVRTPIDGHAAVVAMPEGNYPCSVTIERARVGRRRWPWTQRWLSSHDINMAVPIPVPGKGENSWDCDDDAFYSQSGPEGTVAEACASMAAGAMRQRERYGSGQRWEPSAGWPEGVQGRG